MTARARPVPTLARSAALLAVLLAAPALARPRGAGLDALIDGAPAAIGRPVRLTGLRCADTGGGGLVCKTERRGRIVAVSARRTGPRTAPAAGRRFSAACVGLSAFGKPACTFDVAVTPTGIARGTVDAGQGRRPLVTIEADSFDLF